jgi:hypothetical protein
LRSRCGWSTRATRPRTPFTIGLGFLDLPRLLRAIGVGTDEQSPPPIQQQQRQPYVNELSALSDEELAAAFGARP